MPGVFVVPAAMSITLALVVAVAVMIVAAAGNLSKVNVGDRLVRASPLSDPSQQPSSSLRSWQPRRGCSRQSGPPLKAARSLTRAIPIGPTGWPCSVPRRRCGSR